MTVHDDIEALIPWYVNGTLNEGEMDRVNRHLQDCPRCATSVKHEVRLAREMRTEPAGLTALIGTAGWPDLAARLPPQTRRRRVPAAVLMSLILGVAGASFLLGQRLQQPVFETMTAPSAHPGPLVQVMFEPNTPEHVIRAAVLEAGGTLVAGPTATGIYRIGLEEDGDGAGVAQRLERLSAVRWASAEAP